MFFPGRNHVSVALVDDVVEAKLELCMLAKGAKYLGHRPFRIQNREDVTDLRVAVTGQLLDTADGDPERRKGVHRSHSYGKRGAGLAAAHIYPWRGVA